MNEPVSYDLVPPVMPLRERVVIAWSVLRGGYNTGLNRTGRGQFYHFKPYVLEAVFEYGDRIRLQTKTDPSEPRAYTWYVAEARRAFGFEVGKLTMMRVISRSSGAVVYSAGWR